MAVIETHLARFVLICFCHSVFLGISSPGLIYNDIGNGIQIMIYRLYTGNPLQVYI